MKSHKIIPRKYYQSSRHKITILYNRVERRPIARLITSSPCFTVKAKNDRFACGTEAGVLLIGDIGEGFKERQQAIKDSFDEDETQR